MADGIVTLKERLSDGMPGRSACRAPPQSSWDDVSDDLRWAEKHLSHAASLFESSRFSAEDGSTAETCGMALMHMLLSGYNALEAALLRIMSVLDEEPPSGDEWSFLLVRQLSRPREGRPAFLAEADMIRAVQGLRGYRIVALHAFDDFDLAEAALAVRDAGLVLADIGPALARFRAGIDPG